MDLVPHAPAIILQQESGENIDLLRSFYDAQVYVAKLSSDALIVSARTEAKLIGLVRIELESGLLVLRGMNGDPLHQRQGIGSRVLDFVAPRVTDTRYCLPHRWLEAFYGSIGFVRLPDEAAPMHLRARLRIYRARGEEPILMLRRMR